MAQINLLPWRARLREEKKQQFLTVLGGCLALTLLILCIVHWVVGAKIDEQANRGRYLQQQIMMLDGQLTELKDLQKQKELLLSRMRIIQELQENRLLVVHLFDDLVKLLPDGLFLTSIKREGTTITFEGRAQTNTRVSAFMRKLENSGWYTQPMLREIKDDDKEGMFASRFVLQTQQKMPEERVKANAERH